MLHRSRSLAPLACVLAILLAPACDAPTSIPDAGPAGMDAGESDGGGTPADAARPQACEGTPPACRLLTTMIDCMRVRGCGWSACGGFAVACDDIHTAPRCAAQDGCTWTGSACTGTAIECAMITEADPCRGQTGCTWTPTTQCRGSAIACETLSGTECTMQPGCRPYTGPIDAGSHDGGPRDAWTPMCTIDGGPGCMAPPPPSPLPGCNPERGVECDGDWTGTNPDTGMPFCDPACRADQCCIPRDGRFLCHPRNGDGSCRRHLHRSGAHRRPHLDRVGGDPR